MLTLSCLPLDNPHGSAPASGSVRRHSKRGAASTAPAYHARCCIRVATKPPRGRGAGGCYSHTASAQAFQHGFRRILLGHRRYPTDATRTGTRDASVRPFAQTIA